MLQRDLKGAPNEARITALLSALSARAPSIAEEQALRALSRGLATPGQQKMALRYALDLGGAGDLMFHRDNERITAFRLGSQALVQAIATIAGAAWVSFRADSEEGDDGP